eukprot:TRINITY_DN10225_c0_g1_i1.p1 TRINITY_DN10225_c0_g1~~TRINITY_DN10225_c0_g1_i1.p1  ORF type:complete len:416 (-),score=116.13 TRINITY_DN10225_c0_g1_i1:90-1337(-)
MKSFVKVSPESHFPIQNLPFGVFKRKDKKESARIGVAIGEDVLDLSVIYDAGLFPHLKERKVFHEGSLNEFMSLGRSVWRETRQIITKLLSEEEPSLRDNHSLRELSIIPQNEVEMLLPAVIGDYTDFYSSKEHASNIGTMWRGKENALMPNWLHIPIGYHGRSSSIVVSGTPIKRPFGQTKPSESDPPTHQKCKVLDFELETGFFIGPGNQLGDPISVQDASSHIFGMVLLNDWSARDVQKWEYQPLGPFCGKNFATTISPWVVTLEALEPFKTQQPVQEPVPLSYLKDETKGSYDIQLSVSIQTQKSSRPQLISQTNFKHLYWTMNQQLAHHSSGGCNMRPGDLLASGTISGPTPDSVGSLVEKTWGGRDSFQIQETNEERKYLQDGDTITLEGFCQGEGYRVGFGTCSGTIF